LRTAVESREQPNNRAAAHQPAGFICNLNIKFWLEISQKIFKNKVYRLIALCSADYTAIIKNSWFSTPVFGGCLYT
jgi:hypothetical protein